MTDKIITIDLGQYRDSFSIQDLACGTVVIPGMKEITLTTSEFSGDAKAIQKEERKVRKPIPKPSAEELRQVYNDGKQSIKFVQEFYGVSKTTARRWLLEMKLLEAKPLPTLPQHDLPLEPTSPEPAYPAVTKGRVDWDVMWPIVKAELDKGRDKYEIAAEFNIGKDSMKNKVQKMMRKDKPKPTENIIPALEKIQTISDLIAYREHLANERRLVDLVLKFVDIALREKEEGQYEL